MICAVPFALLSCAGQAPPAGGPVDTDPPVILSVYPRPNTTLFKDQRISFEFDEFVDRGSVESSIFISPYVEKMEYSWSGKEVEIIFGEKLKENTTYVVTVGTDVVDINNRNRMAQAFSLAFSTGDQIDRGAISGRVFPLKPSDPPAGVMIFAYGLEKINPDTLNPAWVRPDYITQTGKDGSFLLSHVALQPYRVVAVRDDYKNLLYDAETDEFGIPSKSTRLSPDDTLQSDLTIHLAREDTTAPRLVKVTPVNNRLLVAEFSELVDTAGAVPSNFALTDTAGTNAVRIISIAQRIPKLTEFYVGTEQQQRVAVYRLRVSNVLDLAGHPMSEIANTVDFTSSDSVDVVPPNIAAVYPPDSAKNISPDVAPVVSFSEPVRGKLWNEVVQLRDSLERTVPCRGGWLNDAAILLQPVQSLDGNSRYHVSVAMAGLGDMAGNTAKDTTLRVSFMTLDPDQMSSIEGAVSDLSNEDTTGVIVITARNVAPAGGNETTVRVRAAGPFVVDKLAGGKYTLEVYRDRNENGKFDPGRVFPFSPAERFSVYPDTLKLRARWPLEGVKIQLR